MWTRPLLKSNAKQVLRQNYWTALLVCFVTALLTGGGGTPRLTYNYNTYSDYYNSFDPFHSRGDGSLLNAFLTMTPVLVIILLAASLALSVLVSSPIQVGQKRYFMEGRLGRAPFSTLFSAFGNPAYWNVVMAMLLKSLHIFLWSLLFVIPGIYKAYQYRMVEYLLAENPYLPAERALELSREMTNGEKFNIFLLDLSFLGWELLGAMLLGLGGYFVLPYIEATNAELYAALRAKIFSLGLTDEGELSGFLRY